MAGRPSFNVHVDGNGKVGFHQLFPKVKPYMKEYVPWEQSKRLEGVDKQVASSVLLLLEHVSGGNVAGLLGDVFRNSKNVLWRACMGLSEESIAWSAEERSGIMRAMRLSGWTAQEVAGAGFEPTRREWRNVTTPDSKTIGRPANEELHDSIVAEWHSASVDSCIVLKRLSRERGEDITIRHVQTTFIDVYKNSALNPDHPSATSGLTVSKTQFMRFRPVEIRRAKRRTDMCEYCLLAAGKIDAINRILKRARMGLSTPVSVPNALLLDFQVRMDATLSAATRRQLLVHTEWLLHADKHSTTQKLQRAAYNGQLANPGNAIIVTLDFKEKGVLPVRRSAPSYEFYERGKYSVLGISFVWSHHGTICKSFLDVLLPTLNQDAACVLLVWQEIIAFLACHITCDCCSLKGLSVWADSGRHFMCKLTISFLLHQPRVRTLNFFCAKHGKSLCDSHFGRCSAALESCPTDILSLNRVCELLQTIPNTTAKVVFLHSQKLPSVNVYDIEKVHCIHSYTREGSQILISPTANSSSHAVTWSSSAVSPQFEGKVSDKLPGISSLQGKVVFVHDEGQTREEKRETVTEGALRRHQERYEAFWQDVADPTSNSSPKARIPKSAPSNRKCSLCHKTGHYAPRCPERDNIDEESESDDESAEASDEEPHTPKRAKH